MALAHTLSYAVCTECRATNDILYPARTHWGTRLPCPPLRLRPQLPLYESDLDDNGVCALTVKLRVMPRCWLVLLRLWVRVDGSMVRLRETRLFCRWGLVHGGNWKVRIFAGLSALRRTRLGSGHVKRPLGPSCVLRTRARVSINAADRSLSPMDNLRRHDKLEKRFEVLQVTCVNFLAM